MTSHLLPFYEGVAPQAFACGGGDASPGNSKTDKKALREDIRRKLEGIVE